MFVGVWSYGLLSAGLLIKDFTQLVSADFAQLNITAQNRLHGDFYSR